MLNTDLITRDLSSYTPFKDKENVIKSEWKGSIWSRKQVRIRVESSGELSIQTVAQNRLAQLASTILKFLSCGRIKSLGKNVVSYTNASYTLPANTDVPLSQQKQKAVFDLQCGKLLLFFIPNYEKLSKLGDYLIKYAIRRNDSQKVWQKALDMNEQILDFLKVIGQEFLKDIEPADLYELFQKYDLQVIEMCAQYPIILKNFIDACEKDDREVTPAIETSAKTPQTPPVIDTPVVTPSTPLTLKEKYLQLLDFAKNHVVDLLSRTQLTSAEWLEKQIQITVEQFPLEIEDESTLESAIESLENALDCTVEDMQFVDQLLEISEDSPNEQKLKELVLKDIRETLNKFSESFDVKINDIAELVKTTEECEWHQTLKDFYDKTRLQTEEHGIQYDTFNSFIPGVQAGRHWINPWHNAINPIVSLETLNRYDLANHKAIVDKHCKTALDFLENETQVEKILKLRPEYEQLIALLPKKLEQLEQSGQYHHLAVLQNLKSKHEEIIRKASTLLTGASGTLCYAQALEKAIAELQKQLDQIEKNPKTEPMEQLDVLKQLSSPYYEIVHQQVVDKAKGSLESYLETLTSYQNNISEYLPILVEKKSELAEGLIAIESKIKSKISEAKALSVDYTTRLHVWQIYASQIPLDQLPPAKLKEYTDKALSVVKDGLDDISQDAATIGLKFD